MLVKCDCVSFGFVLDLKGEPGELVGKIVRGEPMREFDGYANPEATKKKLAFDVFKKGDCYFLTGNKLISVHFHLYLNIIFHGKFHEKVLAANFLVRLLKEMPVVIVNRLKGMNDCQAVKFC